jgi:hypothetical protein
MLDPHHLATPGATNGERSDRPVTAADEKIQSQGSAMLRHGFRGVKWPVKLVI